MFFRKTFDPSTLDDLNGDGLLWKIEKTGSEPSYLFGTFHTPGQSLIDEIILNARFRDFVSMVDTVFLECDQNELATYAVSQSNMPDHLKLSQCIDDAGIIEKIKRLFNENFSSLDAFVLNLSLDQYQPWFVAMLLQAAIFAKVTNTKAASLNNLDMEVEKLAIKLGKKIIYLEEVKPHAEVLGCRLPIDKQATSLKTKVNNIPQLQAQLEECKTLYASYRANDLVKKIKADDRQGWAKNEDSISDLLKETLPQRDKTIVNGLRPYLDKEKTLTVVGLLHLPGVLHQLKSAGYQISCCDLFNNKAYQPSPFSLRQLN